MEPDLKDQHNFWEVFHEEWTRDRGDGERRPDYNKNAWMYVQAKMENYFHVKKEKEKGQ